MNDIDSLKVSVIIPTYMREKELCDTLRQLLAQTRPADEIIVVDDTPQYSKQTEEFLKRLCEERKILFIRQKKTNVSIARNRGIKEASGDIIISLDDDVTFGENFIEAHLKNYSDKNIDAVTGQMLCPAHLKPTDVIPKGFINLPLEWIYFPFNFSFRKEVNFVIATNFSIRRTKLLKAGGFDENLSLMEDSDLAWRLYRIGANVVFDPEPSVFNLSAEHGGVYSLRTISFLVSAEFLQNIFYFYIKNFSKNYPGYVLHIIILQLRRWVLTKRNISHPHFLLLSLWRFIFALSRAICLIVKGRKLI